METLDPSLPIVAIQILGWKTERWGDPLTTLTADTVLVHQSDHSVSETIKRTMEKFGLEQKDIINITAERNAKGDIGSHDFWMFVRNPHFLKTGDAE